MCTPVVFNTAIIKITLAIIITLFLRGLSKVLSFSTQFARCLLLGLPMGLEQVSIVSTVRVRRMSYTHLSAPVTV